MDPKTKFRLYRFSVWCGVIVLIGNTIAFNLVGHIFPPVDPSASPAEMAAFIQDHRNEIKFAVILMAFVAPLFYFFAVITSLQMRRIEGEWGLLSMIQLTTGVVAPTGWVYPLATLSVATFREGRSPEQISLIVDQFYLTYVGVAVIFTINILSIGIAALVDKRANPVFPRWFGWFNVIICIPFAPGAFVYATQTGPFAWNGAFALWIPSVCFGIWKVTMIVMLLRAVKSEEQETLALEPAMAMA